MKMVPLGEMLSEYKQLPKSDEDFPVLTLTERNGFVKQSDRFNKRLATEDTSKYKVVEKNDIAFNPYLLWAGALAQNIASAPGVISPLYPTFRVKNGFDPTFVYRLLLTPQMITRYDSIAFGSVPRRRRSSVKDFLNLEIPAPPPLDEQRRIAAILDKADSIRQKRRQALAHLDTLTQSIFHELNSADIAKTRYAFQDVIKSIGTGSSPKCEGRPANEFEWGVLKLSAVTTGKYLPSENKAYNGDPSAISRFEVQAGDLLMTRKNTPELVGAATLVESTPPMLTIPDIVFRISPDSNVATGRYLQTYLMSPKVRSQVRALAGGSAKSMSNISMSKLKSLPVELPDLAEQVKFGVKADAIAIRRTHAQDSAKSADVLFASLQSLAFKGEL